jgi:beta-glucosidase
LQSQHIPVVAVFLSGRPMWTNPEINASDAFVAAWLPGTEGGAVADILIGDAAGRPRHDFHGRLSYAWPADAGQTLARRHADGSRPQFPLDYGLTYADHRRLARLSEDPKLTAALGPPEAFFAAGREAPGWAFAARPSGAVTISPEDAGGVQEGGRRLEWRGDQRAEIALHGPVLDLARQANGAMAVQISLRVDQPPSGAMTLALGCDGGCKSGRELDLSPWLRQATAGQWRVLKVKLSCLAPDSADEARIVDALRLASSDPATLTLSDVRLAADPTGAYCGGGP